MGLVYRCGNRALYFQAGGDMDPWVDPHPWQSTTDQSTSATTSGLATTYPTTSARRMKNTHVLDQSDETEFDVADDIQHARWIQKPT